jgi:hypothetical protein
MKTLLTTLAFVAVLGLGTVCQADIVSVSFADDGDGVLTCNTYGFQSVGRYTSNSIPEYQVNIDGSQKLWGTGDIFGTITTDTEEDPKLTLLHDIDNDTAYDWTDYHAVVTMSKTFTFDNVTVDNAGWTFVVTQPVLVGSDWVGSIDYYANGNPVAPLGDLSFSYRMTFIGSASYHEELTPSGDANIPEPSMMVLLAGGLVGLFVVRRKFVG